MNKILLSVMTIGVVGVTTVAATRAFFSDTETSRGNVLSAGEIDLTIDSEAHYAGMVCKSFDPDDTGPLPLGYYWDNEELDSSTRPELLNAPCDGTWEATDLSSESFFSLEDIKPGDSGENTISMHVENNDAFMCAAIYNMEDLENEITEPEEEIGDTDEPGELSQEVQFFAWDDDGDNIWEGEPELFSNTSGPASDVLGGIVYPLFTPQQGGSFQAGVPQYIGLYWCYGQISQADIEHGVLSCNGEAGTNLTQTDSLTADIAFYVEQARNNENFACPTLDAFPTPTPMMP